MASWCTSFSAIYFIFTCRDDKSHSLFINKMRLTFPPFTRLMTKWSASHILLNSFNNDQSSCTELPNCLWDTHVLIYRSSTKTNSKFRLHSLLGIRRKCSCTTYSLQTFMKQYWYSPVEVFVFGL